MKIVKKISSLMMMLAFLLAFIRPINVDAAPAPTLTRVSIQRIVYDSNLDVFVEVEYTGRPSTSKVTCNGYDCPEQINYRETVFSNRIEIGEKRYFKTPYKYSEALNIDSFIVYAEAQTLSYPRKTLYDNRIF